MLEGRGSVRRGSDQRPGSHRQGFQREEFDQARLQNGNVIFIQRLNSHLGFERSIIVFCLGRGLHCVSVVLCCSPYSDKPILRLPIYSALVSLMLI